MEVTRRNLEFFRQQNKSRGDDVLIGGSTASEDDDAFLALALEAWNSSASYNNRALAIDSLLTVLDDEDQDKVTGSSGQDLFFDGLGDDLTDVNILEQVL